MTHTSTEQPEALRLAYEIGANRIKVQPTEAERLRFEQWMAGHCWKVGGTWDGTTYRGAAEHGDYLDPQAMHTRQLFAAWRDCAALRDALEASQAQRVPLSEPITHAAHRPTWDGQTFAMTQIKPMHHIKIEQLHAHWEQHKEFGDVPFTAGVRYAERAYGITQEKQG